MIHSHAVSMCSFKSCCTAGLLLVHDKDRCPSNSWFTHTQTHTHSHTHNHCHTHCTTVCIIFTHLHLKLLTHYTVIFTYSIFLSYIFITHSPARKMHLSNIPNCLADGCFMETMRALLRFKAIPFRASITQVASMASRPKGI